jgi:hypothetical protein
LPGHYFVGYFDVTGGSNIRMMDDQAEYVAAIASGAIKLPGRDEMEKAIAADYAWQAGQFPDTPRYGLELDPRRYRKGLAKEYGRNGVTRRTVLPIKRPSPGAEETPPIASSTGCLRVPKKEAAAETSVTD